MRLYTRARSFGWNYSPRLEALESRYCPIAPSISYLHSTAGPHTFMLAGHVTDEQPSGLTVQFTGVYTGTAQTNASGDFNVTIEPSQLGSIYAKVTDVEGLVSVPVQDVLTSMVPMISNFVAMRQFNNYWTFSGTVSDEYAAGLTVRLGGLPSLEGKTATVGADGTFSFTVALQPGEEGTATAQTTDWWAQNSNLATCTVHPSA